MIFVVSRGQEKDEMLSVCRSIFLTNGGLV